MNEKWKCNNWHKTTFEHLHRQSTMSAWCRYFSSSSTSPSPSSRGIRKQKYICCIRNIIKSLAIARIWFVWCRKRERANLLFPLPSPLPLPLLYIYHILVCSLLGLFPTQLRASTTKLPALNSLLSTIHHRIQTRQKKIVCNKFLRLSKKKH